MKRTYRRSIITVLSIIVLFSSLLVGISIYKSKHEIKREIGYYMNVNQVEQYRDLITTHAIENEIENYVDTLLAIMMQESGGRGNDPMQASESLCGAIGCIDNPELSIKQGVSYFKQTLEAADGDVELAIQSYNFGVGFVYYANDKNKKYSEKLAIQFSQEMYGKAADKSIYSCLRKEAKQYDACYGDIYYVRDVLAYRDIFSNARNFVSN